MASLIYDFPSDKQTGTWTSDGTVDTSYPLTNIDDERPWKPVKFTVNPTRIKCDRGSAKRTDVVSFIHCNFDAGAVIKVQFNATDAWGGPTVNQTLTIPAVAEDGQPGNPFIDFTDKAGYTASGLRWLSIEITSGQSTLLSLGLVRVSGLKRQPDPNIAHDVVKREWHEVLEPIRFGLGYGLGTRNRQWAGAFRYRTEAQFTSLLSWSRAAYGPWKPFLFILDPSVNESAWVKWDGPLFESTYTYLKQTVSIIFNEVLRGLKP